MRNFEKIQCHISCSYVFSPFVCKFLPQSLKFWGWNHCEGMVNTLNSQKPPKLNFVPFTIFHSFRIVQNNDLICLIV
jgi:hypothetical protein